MVITITTRIWEWIVGLPLDVGKRDSMGSGRCWEMLGIDRMGVCIGICLNSKKSFLFLKRNTVKMTTPKPHYR
jgi:hypothetical protein